MQVEIIKATLLINRPSTDWIYFDTQLPAPFSSEVDDGCLSLRFEVQKGHGAQYLKDHFPGLLAEQIDTLSGEKTWL